MAFELLHLKEDRTIESVGFVSCEYKSEALKLLGAEPNTTLGNLCILTTRKLDDHWFLITIEDAAAIKDVAELKSAPPALEAVLYKP